MKNMKHTLRLNAKVFPVIGLFALVMQVTNPARVWVILLMGFGVTWLVCWVWARGLLRALTFEREMRFGWAQVGDHLEERFTLTNTFSLPATSVTVLDHSNLPDHYASLATGVQSAANSTPTTAALAPSMPARTRALRLRVCQNGSAPPTSSQAGMRLFSMSPATVK